MVSYHVKRGYVFFCWDETTFSLKPYASYGWFPVGSRPTQKFNYSRDRFHAFGVINGRKEHYRFYNKINWKNTLNFLGYLHRKYPKMFILWDNPTWHRHNNVRVYLKKHHIKTLVFPTCSPEENPTEQAWKTTKQQTANTYYQDEKSYRKAVRQILRQKNLTKMYEYLNH
jgi:transposase